MARLKLKVSYEVPVTIILTKQNIPCFKNAVELDRLCDCVLCATTSPIILHAAAHRGRPVNKDEYETQEKR